MPPPREAKRREVFLLYSWPSPRTIWRSGGNSRPPGRKQSLRLLDRRLRRLRLRRLVADQPHFAEQLRHLHSRERFEERRYLRGNLGDVPGQFVSAGGIAIACGNDGHLVHLTERLGESAHHFRQSRDEFVEHGGLVVFLEGLGLDVHSLGFSFALLEDDFRFGFALRTNRRGAAFRLAHQALAFGVGQRFDALPLDFRRLQNGSDELAFAALDFRFLYFHLGFALHLLHPHGFFDHFLLHDVGFDFIRFVGGGLGLLGHLQIAGLLDVQVALGFGLLG